MQAVRIVGNLDPNFAWDGSRLFGDGDFGPDCDVPYRLRGAATAAQPGDNGRWRLLRDPLGINKLFWARDPDGTIALAAQPRRLVEEGHPLERIQAIPRGTVIDLDPERPEPVEHSILPTDWSASPPAPDAGLEDGAGEIRSALDRYLAALAARCPSTRAFVCLSGGLDSTGIAALAREHFPDLTAMSFDLARPGGRPSEDRMTAERLSRDLGLPLLLATVSEEELFEHLDTVLVEGVDWRDFNVHAALVNAALAAAVDAACPADGCGAPPRLVLTGDLANEFLADYHPERYRGTTYYRLPRLRPDALRASLVRGLDSSHREVGVFAAWNLPVVQPYAVAADAYLRLPGDFLGQDDSKQQLCRAVFGDLVPEYVYSRKKTRAQVGDPETGGGVLAAAIDRGIDSGWLRRRFADLHDVADVRELDRFLRAGHYRTAVPLLGGRG